MDIFKAQVFAQSYMRLYLDQRWQFMWDMSEAHFGSTQFERHIITLSKPFTAINNEQAVLDALRHEVAHAKTGNSGGPHDKNWFQACCALGGSGIAYLNRDSINVPVAVI